jgi:glutaredoxin
MFYIYTEEDCPRCDKQKREWIEAGVQFEERPALRLQNKTGDTPDQIDVDGFVDLCSKNMQLPAIVEREDTL